MTFTLLQTTLEGMMELRGTIKFPSGRIVVIYGSNQQGKTNVINAIRYNFLKEFKGRGRPKDEYDDRALPTRQELVSGESSWITTEFEYGGKKYVLHREISSGGKRETCDLYQADSPSQRIDPEIFLKSKLKVSLLDILFSPEITGAFKHLHSGGIDDDVDEMFKEISSLRELSESFIQRLTRLKTSAEVASTVVKAAYDSLCNEIFVSAPQIGSLKEYENLKLFEPGKSASKLELLDVKLVKIISLLREAKLSETVEHALAKAETLAEIKGLISQTESIREKVLRLRAVKVDQSELKRWLDSLGPVDRESKLRKLPELKDEGRRKVVENVVMKFIRAKTDYAQACSLAKAENTALPDIPSRLRQLGKVAGLLSAEVKVGREFGASVTKVGGEAYAIVPAQLVVEDAAFAEINSNPIPKGTRRELKGYESNIRAKIERLAAIRKLDTDSAKVLEGFNGEGLRLLRALLRLLENKADKSEREIQDWVDDLAANASSFCSRTIKPKTPRAAKDIVSFQKRVGSTVAKAEEAQLAIINLSLKDLGIHVSGLEAQELTRAVAAVKGQQQSLPKLEEAENLTSKYKLEWSRFDEQYLDYSRIPRLADQAILVLQEILSRCFDEAKLKEMMSTTYTKIVGEMQERHVIKAIEAVVPNELRSTLKYRGRAITHPAGSEKALFSLAILTSLAYYFQTPILIDEVANNLDTDNLKAFFEFVREFKDKYGVQFVLSMKTTKDFDLGGWVSEFRNDLVVYQIKDKEIVPIELTAG